MSDIDNNLLTSKQNDPICKAAIKLMQELTKVHGNARGVELFTAIGEILGDDIKYQIFQQMLIGHTYDETVLITGNVYNRNRIMAIKAIRQAKGVSLKEAKDFIDIMDPYTPSIMAKDRVYTVPVQINCQNIDIANKLRKDMTEAGYICE